LPSEFSSTSGGNRLISMPERLSAAPRRQGITPVAMLVRLGTQTGLAQYAFSKRMPSRARESSAGVVNHLLPAQLIMRACC